MKKIDISEGNKRIGKTLHLTLKKKWFDMIASGEKKEEYREIKPYWVNRLTWHEHHEEVSCANSLKDALIADSESSYPGGVFTTMYDTVTFRNGYSKNAPKITLELLFITYGNAKPEWSGEMSGKVFIIRLGSTLPQIKQIERYGNTRNSKTACVKDTGTYAENSAGDSGLP